ncbi:GNAT family N-acetyltransferase [Paenibacillus harenae]|uniref:GNAT family N-acetyltransferase n=1 Tax=Paenibacillus harenae TaxID=306543 RepID=UPI00279105F9|nr:GNAT family N-acetyltransferase [Paenibacillus harenae]MDQ0057988.1 GNAT superfamily N-acetyltransferase [Paenibacillus harenae]
MIGIELRTIAPEELPEAIALELSCYTPEAAATLEGFRHRIRLYPEYFWSAWADGRLVGIVNGVRTSQEECGDELKGEHGDDPEGHSFCVLTVAVDANNRRRGIGGMLLRKLIGQCRSAYLKSVSLMCESHLIGFYEQQGFVLHGQSASKHGGIVWYEMSLDLHTMEHLTE